MIEYNNMIEYYKHHYSIPKTSSTFQCRGFTQNILCLLLITLYSVQVIKLKL